MSVVNIPHKSNENHLNCNKISWINNDLLVADGIMTMSLQVSTNIIYSDLLPDINKNNELNLSQFTTACPLFNNSFISRDNNQLTFRESVGKNSKAN